jgi:hypothetical protein
MDGARSQVQQAAWFGRLQGPDEQRWTRCAGHAWQAKQAATPSSLRASAGSLLVLQASVVPARQRLVMRAEYVGDLSCWKWELAECGTGSMVLGRRDSIVVDREHY